MHFLNEIEDLGAALIDRLSVWQEQMTSLQAAMEPVWFGFVV